MTMDHSLNAGPGICHFYRAITVVVNLCLFGLLLNSLTNLPGYKKFSAWKVHYLKLTEHSIMQFWTVVVLRVKVQLHSITHQCSPTLLSYCTCASMIQHMNMYTSRKPGVQSTPFHRYRGGGMADYVSWILNTINIQIYEWLERDQAPGQQNSLVDKHVWECGLSGCWHVTYWHFVEKP